MDSFSVIVLEINLMGKITMCCMRPLVPLCFAISMQPRSISQIFKKLYNGSRRTEAITGDVVETALFDCLLCVKK